MSSGFLRKNTEDILSANASDLSKTEDYVYLKTSCADVNKLREMKGIALEALRIEKVLNPRIVLKEVSDEDMRTPGDLLVKSYAQHFFKNRKLKHKMIMLNLAVEQKEGMKSLKDKFLNDLNMLSSTKEMPTNEEAYQALCSHLNMLQKRLNAIEKKNKQIQYEFEKKLIKLKHADKKTSDLQKTHFIPVAEAQNKYKSGENLSDEESLQVLRLKWKALNVQLKQTLNKMYQHYATMANKINFYRDILLKLVVESEKNFMNHKSVENDDSGCPSTIACSQIVSTTEFKCTDNVMPHLLARLGNNTLEVTKNHYKLEKLRNNIKMSTT